MARGGTTLPQIAVLGILGLVGWNWAENQPPGSAARKTLDDLKTAFRSKGTAPASAMVGTFSTVAPVAEAGAPVRPLGWRDIGGVPVEFADGVVRQRRDQGGTNTYRVGDVFVVETTGNLVRWVGIGTDAQGSYPVVDVV